MYFKSALVIAVAGTLAACGDSPELVDTSNKLYITFYPSAADFDPEQNEQQTQVFKRNLESTGTSGTVPIMVQQREDGEAVVDASGNALKQEATFRVSYFSSDTFDIYTEDGEFLYTHTVFPEDKDKHYCMPLSADNELFVDVDLPTSWPKDNAEAHTFIKTCRDLMSAAQ